MRWRSAPRSRKRRCEAMVGRIGSAVTCMYSTSTSSGRGIAAKGIGRNPSGTAVCSSPVRAQLRTLLGQTAVYGLGGGVGQAIGVLTLPVFARALEQRRVRRARALHGRNRRGHRVRRCRHVRCGPALVLRLPRRAADRPARGDHDRVRDVDRRERARCCRDLRGARPARELALRGATGSQPRRAGRPHTATARSREHDARGHAPDAAALALRRIEPHRDHRRGRDQRLCRHVARRRGQGHPHRDAHRHGGGRRLRRRRRAHVPARPLRLGASCGRCCATACR